MRLGHVGARLVSDVGTVKRAVLYATIVVLVWSLVYSANQYADTAAPFVLAGVPVVAIAGWRLRRWRPHLYAAAAAASLAAMPGEISLLPAGAALTYLAVHEDRHEFPWPAAVGALVGCVAATILDPASTPGVPYVEAGLGFALGLIVRSLDRLEGETRTLRVQTRRSQQQAAWAEQRTSLARELHDVVGHHVTAMVVRAEAGLVGDPRAALGQIGELGRQALTELDALVVHLRDPDAAITVTAPPRLSDIDELLAAPLRSQGVDVSVRVDPEPGLDEVGVLTAYRITQEALTNVTRHAHARSAWVELGRTGRQVRLRVSDDGVGPPATVDRGAGLVGIEERVRALDGSWDLSERPGGGTILDVFLPV